MKCAQVKKGAAFDEIINKCVAWLMLVMMVDRFI